MKYIQLTQGKSATIDDEDFERVSKFKWFCRGRKTYYYAMRFDYSTGRRITIHLHHFVFGKSKYDKVIDHIDGNGLNCQKNNLRECTQLQNCSNRRSYGRSQYLGVSVRFRKDGIPIYIAEICHNKKRKYLGYFLSEEAAAMAYDNAAVSLKGEFANLNFKAR